MYAIDSSSLQQILVTIVLASPAVPLLAWAMRRALTEWSPSNPRNTWSRGLTLSALHVLVGLLLTFTLTLDIPAAAAVTVARLALLVGAIAYAYRIGPVLALGVTLLTQLFITLASGAVTIALMGAWAVSPVFAVLVVVLGLGGITLHLRAGRRLQARFDAVE